MGFEICGILVLWEKGGEEGRNRERKVGQEPWSITPSTASSSLLFSVFSPLQSSLSAAPFFQNKFKSATI